MALFRSLCFVGFAAAFAWGCSSKEPPTPQNDTGGNTSWLKQCANDAHCGQGGICFAGVCSSACERDDTCTEGQNAGCFSGARNCADTESVCLPKCDTSAVCLELGNALTCSGGFCVPVACAVGGSSTAISVDASNDATSLSDADAPVATLSAPRTSGDSGAAASTPGDSGAAASTRGDLDASVLDATVLDATATTETAVSSPVLPSGDVTLPDAGKPSDEGTFSVKLTNPLNCCDVYTLATYRAADDTCLFVEVRDQVGSVTTVTGVKRSSGAPDCWDSFFDANAQQATVFDGAASTYFEGNASLMTLHALASFSETNLWPQAELEVTARGILMDEMWHMGQ